MLFEQLFLNQMPEPIRLQLADADFTDPLRLAEQSDGLWLPMNQKISSVIHAQSNLLTLTG